MNLENDDTLGPCRDLGPKVERRAFTSVIKSPWCFPDICNELPGGRLSVTSLGPKYGTDAQSLNLVVTAITVQIQKTVSSSKKGGDEYSLARPTKSLSWASILIKKRGAARA